LIGEPAGLVPWPPALSPYAATLREYAVGRPPAHAARGTGSRRAAGFNDLEPVPPEVTTGDLETTAIDVG
jgi:hypothetical protein